MEQENMDVTPDDEATGSDLQATVDELTAQNTALANENEALQSTVAVLTEQNEALYSTLSDLGDSTATVIQQNDTLIANTEKLQYTLSIFLCFLVLYSVWGIGKIFYKWLSSFF